MKNFWLIIIALVFSACLPVALPKIEISNETLNINSSIGGYVYQYTGVDGSLKTIDLSDFKYGLDIQGGLRVVLAADLSEISSEEAKSKALESTKTIIESRVNQLGVSEPRVTSSVSGGTYRIYAELPGIQNIEQAIQLVGSTAQISFKELKPDVAFDRESPDSFSLIIDSENWVDTGISGDMLVDALVANDNFGRPAVQLSFSSAGREIFSQVIARNINRPVGIFLDDNPIPLSAPVVSPDLANQRAFDPVIEGDFDLAEATNLAIQIRAGSLPVGISVERYDQLAPTLGTNIINYAFEAGLLAFVLIIAFINIMHPRYGYIATFGLILYVVVTLALFKLIPIVVTLPGIAGLVLSLGMATDANILIFERIREEYSKGISKKEAIQKGFDKAWSSIRDANISTLIICFILFYFGEGAVKGFAVTLSLGILISLTCCVFFVKKLFKGFNLL
jgi:preprotein translocase subunit SecD